MSGSFVSLKNAEFRRLWWGGLFSFISVQMQFFLRGILAWDLTEREGALGLVYLVFGFTMLLSTPLGGVASDRLSKKKILVTSQAVVLMTAAGMGLAVISGHVQFWMLLLAAIAQGAAFGFFGPARVSFSSELVGRKNLGNAIALSLLSMNGTRVFAPAMAGMLAGLALVGIGGAYLVSAGFSMISFLVLLSLPKSKVRQLSKGNPFENIVEAIRYVAADHTLRNLMVTSFLVVMFGFNYVSFYPAMVKGVFGLGDEWVGIASSASAVGAVISAFYVSGRSDSPQAKKLLICSGFGFGAGVLAFGLAPNIVWSIFAVMIVGASATLFQTISNTLALAITTPSYQGRVQSLFQLSFAGFGLAAAPIGLLAEAIGLRLALGLMGLATMMAVVFYMRNERVFGDEQTKIAVTGATRKP